MNSSPTVASVQELWRTVLDRAMEIWAPSDFHFFELTYPRFQELLPEFAGSIAEFSRTACACAADKNLEAVQELYRGFAGWLVVCDLPKSFCGQVHRSNYDLFKFVGHEMFVNLISSLLHYEFWDALNVILSEDWGHRYQTRIHYWSAFFQYSTLFEDQEVGPIQRIDANFFARCSLEDFQAADLFLYWHQRSQRNEQTSPRDGWYPWSLKVIPELPNHSRHAGDASVLGKFAKAALPGPRTRRQP